MRSSLPPGYAPSGLLLALAFTAVVGSFFTANFIVQNASGNIGALSDGLINNVSPSIEHLARIRRTVLEAELTLSHILHEPSRRAEEGRRLELNLKQVNEATRAYVGLPTLPGEQPLRLDVQESWARFDDVLREARTLAMAAPSPEALAEKSREVEAERQAFLNAVTRAIEHGAVYGREVAQEIRDLRERTRRLANLLNAVCGVVAGVMAWLLHRQARTRQALFTAHADFLHERAAEMETFAGRVAHDIRNPLSAARMAAELAIRKNPESPERPRFDAILRSLSRADAITGGLLAFARSGSKPDPGARTEPRAAITDTLDGFAAEAEQAGIELRLEPPPQVLVACGTGVYLSLFGNLVRNAIKYMGDAQTRRITIKVIDQGTFVRTEVIDTGPGIAPELLPSLFQPYFRGHSGGAEGLGLGLATVKKLAEGHGGRAGVSSERGKGSRFWFELPRAGSAWEPAHAAGEAPVS
jgi:signal transduction histidine kinase